MLLDVLVEQTIQKKFSQFNQENNDDIVRTLRANVFPGDINKFPTRRNNYTASQELLNNVNMLLDITEKIKKDLETRQFKLDQNDKVAGLDILIINCAQLIDLLEKY